MKISPNAIKMKISPKVAIELLDRHEKLVQSRGGESLNRNINDNLVARYAKDMMTGKWEMNGETVKIATSGRILDGQHRLWASANHTATFDTMIVTGLDEQSFYTIDIGRSRRPSDFLTVDGVANSPVVAAAARIVIGYRRKQMRALHMLPSHEIVSFAKANKRLVDSAAKVHGCNKIAPLSAAAAWHFLFSESNREMADTFIDDLRDGVGLSAGDPVLALRERLIKNRASKTKLTARDIFIVGIRAWNDRRSGKARKITKILASDADQSALPKVA